MAILLQEAWDRILRLPEEEQERIARRLLDELPAEPEAQAPPEPFVVKAWDFGLPADITMRELKAIAYGEDD